MLDYLENKLISIFFTKKKSESVRELRNWHNLYSVKNLHLHELTKLFIEVFKRNIRLKVRTNLYHVLKSVLQLTNRKVEDFKSSKVNKGRKGLSVV